MSKTIREVTQEQFADGTTIDGRRLDSAMADVVDRANAVTKKDLQRRWMQTQYVGGWMPMMGAGASESHFPFLNMRNDDAALFPATSYPDGKAHNEFRLKGHSLSAPSILGIPSGMRQYAVTNSFYFRKPVVLTGCSLVLSSGTEDSVPGSSPLNDFHYSSDANLVPYGKENQFLDDLYVGIVVDNPFLPEDRRLNSVVYHRMGFSVETHLMKVDQNPSSWTPAPTTMRPVFPGELFHAIFLDDQNLNIPLARDSRVRFAFAIPEYGDPAVGTNAGAWGQEVYDEWIGFWISQYYSWTLTVLESVED
tara:strand:+ start:1594 stop:2514 length:921 start_codon:yes stop_codon:yes gene_type:complete